MAHRGGAGLPANEGKENTLAAFQQAVSLGYRYIETDVQATRDGRLVCMHDLTLERVAGIVGPVADYTAAELEGVTIGGEPVPFFDDVVDALPETRFNVDLKTPDAVEPLVRAIATNHLENRILVASFSQTTISRFRSLTEGKIPTAMSPVAAAWTGIVPVLSRIISSPAVAMQVPVSQPVGGLELPVVTRSTIDRVHHLGKVIHVWTIDDADEMNRLVDMGVDGIVTDRPDVLKDVLISRNLWETGI